MIRQVFKILMIMVMLIVSILPQLYIHTCSGNICTGKKGEININILNNDICCTDNSFLAQNDTDHKVNRKCCSISIISQEDGFLTKANDIVFSNPDFILNYLLPAVISHSL